LCLKDVQKIKLVIFNFTNILRVCAENKKFEIKKSELLGGKTHVLASAEYLRGILLIFK